MSNPLQVQSQVSLKAFNSFNLEVKTKHYLALESKQQLLQLPKLINDEPVLLLGGGSNLLFTQDFNGLVIHNRLMGKVLELSKAGTLLTVGAGENWHDLVQWTLDHGMPGLENLALIPGTVGAAPVQNIGAYGCDFAQFCHCIEAVNLKTGMSELFFADQCQFAYRSSIFKTQLGNSHIITSVCLKLPIHWHPTLDYGPLRELEESEVTPSQVFEQVVITRQQKLPDPSVLGNAGSFFKNPQIPSQDAERLKKKYPTMPAYPSDKSAYTKLAAGWLIDQCGLKGRSIGGAQVHQEQALVLVNTGTATSSDIISLAKLVQQTVFERFGVKLEPEVRMIAAQGEISL